MSKKANSRRDAFTFSLGGMTTVASFVAAPALADDRINKALDERLRQARKAQNPTPRGWLHGRRKAAHESA